MMCQFHLGTMELSNQWRIIGMQGTSYPGNLNVCFRGFRNPVYFGTPSVCCHENRTAYCHGSQIACCHENEMLRHSEGAWPAWRQMPVVSTHHSNRVLPGSGCRGGKKNPTSFSISDILGGPSEDQKKDQTSQGSIVRPWDDETSSSDRSSCSRDWRREEEDDDEEEIDVGGDATKTSCLDTRKSDCPLNALLRMTTRTHFEHTEIALDYTSDDSGSEGSGRCGHLFPAPAKSSLFQRSSHPIKKRRKTRTAFTNHQIFHLEKRFLYQKYLTPADRDELALSLRLSNSQVITWFQNRRAKLKRDLEELKADVSAAKALGTEPSTSVLSRLDELMKANDNALKRKDRHVGDGGRPPLANLTKKSSTPAPSKADDDLVSTTVKDSCYAAEQCA